MNYTIEEAHKALKIVEDITKTAAAKFTMLGHYVKAEELQAASQTIQKLEVVGDDHFIYRG